MIDVVVKKSKINGKGVFAARDFLKGEVVLKWKPKIVAKDDIKNLSKEELNYVYWANGQTYLSQPPERYINHSCEANTSSGDGCDIATRDIKKGEEITSNYKMEESVESFKCNCGSKKCRGIIEAQPVSSKR